MFQISNSTQISPAGNPKPTISGIWLLSTTGILLVLGYIAYFFLMQSHSLWQSPALVPDKWKKFFYPIKDLFPVSWVRAHQDTPFGLLNVGLYLLLLAFLFAVYIFAVRRAFAGNTFRSSDSGRALRIILVVSVAILAILFIVPGLFSSDLFSYVWYGRILGVYGDNPLLRVPADYAWYDKSHWLQWVYWKDTSSVYGPVWLWFAAGIAKIAQALDGDIVTHLLGHKLFAALAHLLNIWLLWHVSGIFIRRYWPKDRTKGGVLRTESPGPTFSPQSSVLSAPVAAQIGVTLSYAWNPLFLIEFGANGHNDVLIVTGLLGALWLHLRGYWRTAVVLLALTCLVKAIVLIFLPGYLWLLFWESDLPPMKQRLTLGAWRVTQALALSLAVWVFCYLPFWQGPASLNVLVSGPAAEYFIDSLGAVVRFKLAEGISHLAGALGWQPTRFWSVDEVGWRLDWPARWGPLAITAAVAFTQTWDARTFPRMLSAWGWVLFAYLTIGSVWFWPWYVPWLIVPAVLLGPGRLFTATLILCASSMSLYAIYPKMAPPFQEVPGWTGLVIMCPPLLYVGISYWLEALRRKTKPEEQIEPLAQPESLPVSVPVPAYPEPAHVPVLANHQHAGRLEPAYFVPNESQEGLNPID
jgi:hypothetical protein